MVANSNLGGEKMICIVLAAGYATRLYPLTENFPKPLLMVKGKTILDWLLDDIDESKAINQYVVISNHRYQKHFQEWKSKKVLSAPITLLDDGTLDNDNRLGAVKDIAFAINELQLNDDLLVIAGDNVLDFSLCQFIDYFEKKQTSCVMRYFEPNSDRLKKCGVVAFDKDDLLTSMIEKPQNPPTNWCVPPFYIYCKRDIPLVAEGILEGCGTDAPGSFIEWLCKQSTVHAMEMKGMRYDIGDLESYNAVQEQYNGIQNSCEARNETESSILVTGAAGFIGFHLAKKLLEQGTKVIGYDNVNDYYDVNLKYMRLDLLKEYPNFIFIKGDLADKKAVTELFEQYIPNVVVNLAAQAGVRYSIENPQAYIDSNIIGFFNILEACRNYPVEHLVYASSSSVYGNQEKIPFSTDDKVDNPISLYAATKKTNELMAYTYSHLYDIPTTGLRFFTVYGPYGRPDMAYFSFTKKIFEGDPIKIFNNGDMYRDFTYIDDVVQGIENIIVKPPKVDKDGVRYKLYNLGNNKPEKLMYFIETLEKCIGKKAIKEFLPMQPGDVYQTYADVTDLINDFDFRPDTPISDGLARFVDWWKGYQAKA